MKFVYVDESGERNHSAVFVMCGLVIDAYRLRKKTEEFDQLLSSIHNQHPGDVTDFKTSKFMRGKGGWRFIEESERKIILRKICELAVSRGDKIIGLALSFPAMESAIKTYVTPPKSHHWQLAAMFIASRIQKEMQREKNIRKGLALLIMDDNKTQMSLLSSELHARRKWYDGLYEVQRKNKGWMSRTRDNRFDKIINTAFAIKSDHATLIQVADAICYVYRRYLELTSMEEEWNGERNFYTELFQLLESARHKLGRCPPERQCIGFFEAAKHDEWEL